MKNTILLLLSLLLLSCSNSQLEISIANEEDIALGKSINLSLINNSKNDNLPQTLKSKYYRLKR